MGVCLSESEGEEGKACGDKVGVDRKSKGYLAVSASLDKEGNVRLSCCIERDYGDEDGFGVEPDVYLCGTVGEDGRFIKPLYVE